MNILINILWVVLGCILTGAAIAISYSKGFFNGHKQGSDSKDEFIKLTDEEFARQREMTTDSCISVMEELYKDKDTKCIKNCGKRETGSERIDKDCTRAFIKHGEKLHYKKLQDAKENPDLCSRCQLATSCQQPEEPVDECPDFKSLCDTCHVVDSCEERDDKKVSCDGHVLDEKFIFGDAPFCTVCKGKSANNTYIVNIAGKVFCSVKCENDWIAEQEAVKADIEQSNKEAADILPSPCKGCEVSGCDQDSCDEFNDYTKQKEEILVSLEKNAGGTESLLESVQDINHAKALDRCESTREACQKSIGMTEDEIADINGRIVG